MQQNPLATDGFDFLEFSTPTPEILENQFKMMGFTHVATHSSKDIKIFQQNEIKFIINQDPHSFARKFSALHGPSVSAMGFKVKKNPQDAKNEAIAKGAEHCEGDYGIPAISGVGNSIIYFVDSTDEPNYFSQFHFHSAPTNLKELVYIDHVTHNLHRGKMEIWYQFYKNIFNFREVRYFDIEGRLTGLKSRALTSPCGKIRIPLNESSDDQSQIEEFLKDFNGEGIQHIALGSNDIYSSVESLRQEGLEFLETPNTYYDLIEKRLPNHKEPLDQLKAFNILIDGTTHPEVKLLLQIFTKNMLGPIFFEIIQRKGDEGFGEGNFKALFESIELDQINRGVLSEQKEKI